MEFPHLLLFPWSSMVFHGIPCPNTPWNSIDFHGVPWNSMGLFHTGIWTLVLGPEQVSVFQKILIKRVNFKETVSLGGVRKLSV